MSNDKKTELVIAAFAAVTSSTCELVKPDEGMTDGILTLTCHPDGIDKPAVLLELSLTQFDDIYRNMVKQWPTIKPVKDQMTLARQSETKQASLAAKEAAKAERDAEKVKAAEVRKADIAARKAARDAEKATRKAEREAALATAKAAREAKEKADAEVKKKADMAKLAKAATAADAAGKLPAGKPVAPVPVKPAVKPAVKPVPAKK